MDKKISNIEQGMSNVEVEKGDQEGTIKLYALDFAYNIIKFFQDALVFLTYEKVNQENRKAVGDKSRNDFIHCTV